MGALLLLYSKYHVAVVILRIFFAVPTVDLKYSKISSGQEVIIPILSSSIYGKLGIKIYNPQNDHYQGSF